MIPFRVHIVLTLGMTIMRTGDSVGFRTLIQTVKGEGVPVTDLETAQKLECLASAAKYRIKISATQEPTTRNLSIGIESTSKQ